MRFSRQHCFVLISVTLLAAISCVPSGPAALWRNTVNSPPRLANNGIGSHAGNLLSIHSTARLDNLSGQNEAAVEEMTRVRYRVGKGLPQSVGKCVFDPALVPGAPGVRIDVVVTWVNHTARAGCHGDLRTLLRSLKKHGLWPDHVGTVWVTVAETHFNSCQRVSPPSYLKWTQSDRGPYPRMKFVRHREYFLDPKHIWTSNRDAVFAGLAHIPGLAEWFIKFDDDMTLTRPFNATHWFNPKTMRIRYRFDSDGNDCPFEPENRPVSNGWAYPLSMRLANWLLKDRFGIREVVTSSRGTETAKRDCRKKLFHSDHVALLYNKCVCQEALQLFHNDVLQTESRRYNLDEGTLSVNMNSLFANYAIDAGYGESTPVDQLNHVKVHTNDDNPPTVEQVRRQIASGLYLDANFQGPGIDLAYEANHAYYTEFQRMMSQEYPPMPEIELQTPEEEIRGIVPNSLNLSGWCQNGGQAKEDMTVVKVPPSQECTAPNSTTPEDIVMCCQHWNFVQGNP